MALLNQSAHALQLTSVMSSNQWKRPWTDVESYNLSPVDHAASPTSRSSPPRSEHFRHQHHSQQQQQQQQHQQHQHQHQQHQQQLRQPQYPQQPQHPQQHRQSHNAAERRDWRLDARHEASASAAAPAAPAVSPASSRDSSLLAGKSGGGVIIGDGGVVTGSSGGSLLPASHDAIQSNKRPRYENQVPSLYSRSQDDAVSTRDNRPMLSRQNSYGAMPPGIRPPQQQQQQDLVAADSTYGSERSPRELQTPRSALTAASPTMPGTPIEKGTGPSSAVAGRCQSCQQATTVTPMLVQGLNRLHLDLQALWSSSSSSGVGGNSTAGINSSGSTTGTAGKENHSGQDKRSNYLPNGLLDSLDWSLEKLNESIDLARGMLGSRRAQEQAHTPHQSGRYGQASGSNISGSSRLDAAEKRDAMSGPGSRHHQQHYAHGLHRRSPPGSEDGRRHTETLPPILADDPHASHRPPPLSTQSSFSAQPSPIHAHPPRSSLPPLPSPSSLSYTTNSTSAVLPPMSPSLLSHPTPPTSTPSANAAAPPTSSGSATGPTTSASSATPAAPRSPHTTHLQDLQHQLSTKSLALQILQSEHDKLLSAYHRQQTRCQTLDRKSAVSDTEISSLVEEKIRLQSELEQAIDSVVELTAKLEETRDQAALEKGQWGDILKHAAELENRRVESDKGWKGAEGRWKGEREGLTKRLMELEGKLGVVAGEALADHSDQGGGENLGGGMTGVPSTGVDATGDQSGSAAAAPVAEVRGGLDTDMLGSDHDAGFATAAATAHNAAPTATSEEAALIEVAPSTAIAKTTIIAAVPDSHAQQQQQIIKQDPGSDLTPLQSSILATGLWTPLPRQPDSTTPATTAALIGSASTSNQDPAPSSNFDSSDGAVLPDSPAAYAVIAGSARATKDDDKAEARALMEGMSPEALRSALLDCRARRERAEAKLKTFQAQMGELRRVVGVIEGIGRVIDG